VDAADLRVLVAVAESGGFRAAARELFVSQPTVTRAIARLESDLGVPLFDRTKHGVTLTAHGQVVLRGAANVLSTIDSIRSAVSGTTRPRIRLGAASTAVGTVLAPFLGTWMVDHRDIRIDVIHNGSARLLERLENHECDVVVLASEPPAGFEHRHLVNVRVCACLPAWHPLARQHGMLEVRALANEPVLVKGLPYRSTSLFVAAAEQAGFRPQVAYQCSSGQTLAALAESGLGVAILGDTGDLRGFDLPRRDLLDESGRALSFDLHVVWHAGAEQSPEVMLFVEGLVKDSKARARAAMNASRRVRTPE